MWGERGPQREAHPQMKIPQTTKPVWSRACVRQILDSGGISTPMTMTAREADSITQARMLTTMLLVPNHPPTCNHLPLQVDYPCANPNLSLSLSLSLSRYLVLTSALFSPPLSGSLPSYLYLPLPLPLSLTPARTFTLFLCVSVSLSLSLFFNQPISISLPLSPLYHSLYLSPPPLSVSILLSLSPYLSAGLSLPPSIFISR